LTLTSCGPACTQVGLVQTGWKKGKEWDAPIHLGSAAVEAVALAVVPYAGSAAGNAMHTGFMQTALALAEQARQQGEVPVGAVVVLGGQVIGEGFNQPISATDPTAHAEIVALREAARRIGNYRLTGAEVYVTIEPCQMCVGAMVHARIARVIYGTPEPRAGAIESAMRAHEHPALNHRMEALGGVLEEECRAVMQSFFAGRRAK
jgi:tRNA(adenine34) deaminase